jgi:hypothetical protein
MHPNHPSMDFDGINEAVRCNRLMLALIPGGELKGSQYIVRNPSCADKSPGSLQINFKTGKWSDPATGAKGSGAISWYAYGRSLDQGEAARQIAERLGKFRARDTSIGVADDNSNVRDDSKTEQTKTASEIYSGGEQEPPVRHDETQGGSTDAPNASLRRTPVGVSTPTPGTAPRLPYTNLDVGPAINFLKLLDPKLAGFTFQTFDEDHNRKNPELTKVIQFQDRRKLFHLHALGAGVFITVNETDGKGRKKENITRVRAVFQEDDDGFDGVFPLEPSMVVESSPGHFHRYWLVADPASGGPTSFAPTSPPSWSG